MYLLDDRGIVLENRRSVSTSIDAGTYTLVAAAGNGQSSAYELTLFGHIDNLR